MLDSAVCRNLRLPKSWPSRVRSSTIQVIALAHFSVRVPAEQCLAGLGGAPPTFVSRAEVTLIPPFLLGVRDNGAP